MSRTSAKWPLVNPENQRMVEDFLNEYRARKAKPNTLEQYMYDLKIIGVYVMEEKGDRPFTELKKKDWRDMLAYFTLERNLSNSRANRLMSCLRSLLGFLEDSDEYDYDSNQAARIKGLPREQVRNIVFLENHEVMTLYKYFMKEKRYRDATLLGLLYESAGRKAEIAQVMKDSVHEGRNCTNMVRGKRGKQFRLLYFNLTQQAARLYLEERGEDLIPELFITDHGEAARSDTIYNWVVSWRKVFGELLGYEKKFNVHSFRHSALDNYSVGSHEVCRERKIKSISLDKLMKIANHSSVTTTQGYLQDRSQRELEELFHIRIEGI